MTREKFITLFPHASSSCLRENALLWNWPPEATPAPKRRTLAKILTDTYVQPPIVQNHSAPQNPEPQPSSGHGAMGTPKREALYTGRVSIRVTSYRQRLIDPDNFVAKYFVDCLRYAGFIANDTEGDVEISTAQKKVKAKEDERTEIEITPL